MRARDIRWSDAKDALLRLDKTRGYKGLAECAAAIESGKILEDGPHPNRLNQRIFVIEIEGYAYVVPYVIEGDYVFLKTMFPSRKYTAEYLK